jgi:hypothetical protein
VAKGKRGLPWEGKLGKKNSIMQAGDGRDGIKDHHEEYES